MMPSGPSHASVDVNPHAVRWPCERFYWAVLETSHLSSQRVQMHKRLGFLFENVVPGIPVEELQTSFAKFGPNLYVGCAVAKSLLESELPEGAVTLVPAGYPRTIAERFPDRVSPTEFNLLTGIFTPSPIRVLRRRIVLIAISAMLMVTAILTFGMERRVWVHKATLASLEDLEAKIALETLSLQPIDLDSGQPIGLRMLAEVRQLEQTRSSATTPEQTQDCAAILCDIVQHWPSELNTSAESIVVTPTAITIRGQTPSMSDVQHFANSFFAWPGWEVLQPQSEARSDSVNLVLRIERTSTGEEP